MAVSRSLLLLQLALASCDVGPEPGKVEVEVEDCLADAPALHPTRAVLIDDFNVELSSPICTRSATQRQDPYANLFGYCTECFNDCAGSAGARLDVDIVEDPDEVLRCSGGSLRLDYDLTQGERSCGIDRYAGFVLLLVANDLCTEDRGAFNLEALDVEALEFWVKPVEGDDWDLEVALKDVADRQTDKVLARDYLQGETHGGWQRVVIPIDDLRRGPVDLPGPELRELREVSVTVNSARTGLKGSVLLDDFAFVR